MKKIFTLLMIALAAFTANATVTFKVTVSGSYTPYLYVWQDGSGNDAAWPGTIMTANSDGTYSGTTNRTGSVSFIINNGSGNQTADLSATVADGNTVNVTVDSNMKATVEVEGQGQEPQTVDNLYVLGNLSASDGKWQPNVGLKMVHAVYDGVEEPNEFVCSATFTDSTSYFAFTTTLAQNDGNNGGWDEINNKGYRFGYSTDRELNPTETELIERDLAQKDEGSFKIPAGTYSIKVIVENGVPAKMQIAKGYNNGTVITAVNDVNAASSVAAIRYYNLQGMQSATPFSGLNIMVTTYTDGTTATTKVIK